MIDRVIRAFESVDEIARKATDAVDTAPDTLEAAQETIDTLTQALQDIMNNADQFSDLESIRDANAQLRTCAEYWKDEFDATDQRCDMLEVEIQKLMDQVN